MGKIFGHSLYRRMQNLRMKPTTYIRETCYMQSDKESGNCIIHMDTEQWRENQEVLVEYLRIIHRVKLVCLFLTLKKTSVKQEI